MANKTNQDVRKEVLDLRDSLLNNLAMIRRAIEKDCVYMDAYFAQFHDFKYRPVTSRDTDGTPTGYGQPTEVFIEPLAQQMRTTIKSLLDSIRVIETEILPEDNPEGSDTARGGSDRAAHRAALRASFHADQGAESLPDPVDPGDVERTPKLVEPPKPALKTPPSSIVRMGAESPTDSTPRKTLKVLSQSADRADSGNPSTPLANHSETKPRPWRDTTPRAQSETPSPNVVQNESKPIETPVIEKPMVGLSPALRASLGMGAPSRMSAMRDKYAKPKDGTATNEHDENDDDV